MAIITISEEQYSKTINTFASQSAFMCFADYLERQERIRLGFTKLEYWANAMAFVCELCKEKLPSMLLKIKIDDFSFEKIDSLLYYSYHDGSDIVSIRSGLFSSIYIMLYIEYKKTKNPEILRCMNKIQEIGSVDAMGLGLMIDNFLTDGTLLFDYNYQTGKEENVATIPDATPEIVEKKEVNPSSLEGEEKDIKDQYQVGILFRIMDELFTKAGVKSDCDKRPLAELMHKLTGNSQRSFQNRYSDITKHPLKDTKNTNNQIADANRLLKEIGLDITISKE